MKIPADIGKKFWKASYDREYNSACTKCGTVRKKGETDYSYDSQQFCPNCGKSFAGELVKTAKPVYVIGVYTDWKGRGGYQLSETKPEDLDANTSNGKGYSYWSSLENEIGKEYYAMKEQVVL